MGSSITEKFIGYYEGIIPHVLCRDIINCGTDETWEKRGDYLRIKEVHSSDDNIYYNDIKAAFEDILKKYSESYPFVGVHHITAFRINRYLKNGFMAKHLDNVYRSRDQQYEYPQVSVLLFLNNDYKGGEFVVADQVYQPEEGSAIIFPSNSKFPHEVKPVIEGTRWSMWQCWSLCL